MKRILLAVLIGVVLIGAAYLVYRSQRVEPVAQAPVPPPPAPAATPAAEPAIKHPIAEAQPAPLTPPPEAPPALDASDAAAHQALAGLFGAEAVDKTVNGEGFARRLVATIDNLPRKTVAAKIMPVKPVPGQFEAARDGDTITIAAANYARYTPYVHMLEAVDTGKLIGVYVHFYPLLQQAYRELGYPKGYLNDRTIETIDDLLATPEIDGPVRLTQPRVLYQYADPALEALSAGQKALIRMGPENAAKVKAKLRQIRKRLTGLSK